MPGLDLSLKVRSTSSLTVSDTNVKCHGNSCMDAKELLKQMARQRCVGVNGNSID